MNGRILTLSKWLSSGVIVLMISITTLFYSASGLTVVMWGIQKALPNLTIASSDGVLGKHIVLKGINYHDPVSLTSVKVKSVWLSLKPMCFFQPALCIDKIVVNGVSYSMPIFGRHTESEQHALNFHSISAPFPIKINQLLIKNVRIIQGKKTHRIDALTLNIEIEKQQIQIHHLDVQTPMIKMTLNGKGELTSHYPISFSLHGQFLQSSFKGQAFDLQGHGDLSALSLSGSASGMLTTQLTGSVSLTQSDIPFQLTSENALFHWKNKTNQQYQIHVHSLSVIGSLKQYQLAMSADIEGSNIASITSNIKGRGSLTNLSLEPFTLSSLNGVVSGRLKAHWGKGINVSTNMTLKKVKPDVLTKKLSGMVNGHLMVNASMKSGNVQEWRIGVPLVDIRGEVNGYPLMVKGFFDLKTLDKRKKIAVSASNLVMYHGTNRIIVDGKLADKWNLNLDVNIPDVSKSIPQYSGQIAGVVHFTGNQNVPHMVFDLNGHQLHLGRFFRVDDALLEGDLISLHHPKGKLHVQFNHGVLQQNPFNEIRLDMNGDRHYHNLHLRLLSPELTALISIQGKLFSNGSYWQGKVTQATLTHHQQHVLLQQPMLVNADIKKRKVQLGKHCWMLRRSSLCFNNITSISPQKIRVSAVLHHLSLASLSQWLPKNTVRASGIVNGRIQVDWYKNQDVSIDSDVHVDKGQLMTFGHKSVTIPWDDISFVSSLHKKSLITNVVVNLTKNGKFKITGRIPNVQEHHKKVRGKIQIYQVHLDCLNSYFGEYNQANAVINGAVSLGGYVLHPSVKGQVHISDLLANGEFFPIEMDDGDLNIQFLGYQATLNALLNTPDGDLDIKGNANWENLSAWQVNTHVFAKMLRIDVPPMVKMKLVPDIYFSMQPGMAKITGTVSLPWGQVVVDQLPESAIKVSDDQVIVATHGRAVNPSKFPFKVDTHIQVKIGDSFLLSAFGLKGNLQGRLNITQKDNAPFVTGDINILNGTYRSFGQDLVIQQGKVMMNGSVSKPSVSITAIRNPDNIDDDVTAGINVTGSVDNPKVSVFSDPTMAQANALSYLLRGQDLNAKSGDNSMTMALIGLSLAQSGHVIGDIGKAVGVQDLQLDTSGTGDDSQVTVSGYVLPELQVKYGVGIFNSVGEFTIRYQLMRNLYVEAVSGLTSAVDILYQFEFD